VNYTYDVLSRLTQVTDPTGTYSFTYDNMGRLTAGTVNYAFFSGQNWNTAYAYDAASNRLNAVTSYRYDTLNRLTGVKDFQGNPFSFAYDALGRRTGLGARIA
jgi:YD repeat-containing protein